MQVNAFDVKEFRRALGQFPTGVTVVSTRNSDGSLAGLTASSFNSVSLQPPLILWSVAKGTYCARVFESAEFFVVNVLGKQQVDISNACASPAADRFAGIDYRQGRNGCPVIAGAAAYFECRTWNRYDGGDHLIVVGEVLDFHYSDQVMPLVFTRGSYAVSAPQAPLNGCTGQALPQDGFLSNFLLYQLNKVYAGYSAELYPLLQSEFGISPEEWRVITLLADVGPMALKSLAERVSQPQQECRDSLQRLARRGYLMVDKDGLVSIDGPGLELAKQLFAFAKQHEQSVFRSLTVAQRRALSGGMKTMLSAFAN